MYNIRPTTKFQKDLKRVKKRGFDIPLLTDIIKKLAAGEPLPEKNRGIVEAVIKVERVMGIEPTQSAWKAEILPLNYTRVQFLRL